MIDDGYWIYGSILAKWLWPLYTAVPYKQDQHPPPKPLFFFFLFFFSKSFSIANPVFVLGSLTLPPFVFFVVHRGAGLYIYLSNFRCL